MSSLTRSHTEPHDDNRIKIELLVPDRLLSNNLCEANIQMGTRSWGRPRKPGHIQV